MQGHAADQRHMLEVAFQPIFGCAPPTLSILKPLVPHCIEERLSGRRELGRLGVPRGPSRHNASDSMEPIHGQAAVS